MEEVDFDLASLTGKHDGWRRNPKQRKWSQGTEQGVWGRLGFLVHVGR